MLLRRTLLAVLALCLFLSGCAQYQNNRGVNVTWQDEVTTTLRRGESTRADVLALLGPPSQVVALEGETVFYYLFERSVGEGLILVVYNRMKIDTHYDRAVFFFDDNNVLHDYSTRIAAIDGN